MTITTAQIKELREVTGAGILDCKQALEEHAGDLERAAATLRRRGLVRAAEKADRETSAGLVVVKAAGGSICAVKVECETDFVALTEPFKAFAHRIAGLVLADAALAEPAALLRAACEPSGLTVAGAIQELIGRLGENIVVAEVARYAAAPGSLLAGYIHAGAREGYYGPQEGRIGVLVELGVAGAATAELRGLAHDLALQIAGSAPAYLAPADVPAEMVEARRARSLIDLAASGKPETIKEAIVAGQLKKFLAGSCLVRQAFIRDETISVEERLRQSGTSVTIRRFARLEAGG